jgi:hypothetical protein
MKPMVIYNKIFMSGPDGEKMGNLWNSYQSMVRDESEEEVQRLVSEGIAEEDDPDKFFSLAYSNFQKTYPDDWKERLIQWQETSVLTTKVDAQERKRQFAKVESQLFRYVRCPFVCKTMKVTNV